SNCAFLIGDNAIVRFERISLSIEREKLFTVVREPHVDIACQFIGIESVRRLAELQHYKIRNIDDVIDRADADALNLRAQPLRTWADVHVVDLSRGEKWTFTGRADGHAGLLDVCLRLARH